MKRTVIRLRPRTPAPALTLGALGLLLDAGCGDNLPAAASGPLDLVPITDVNPASDIVEVNLVATQGRTT